MSCFDRHAARYTFTSVIVLLALYLVYLVRSTLFVFTLAILFAYLLAPLVNFLARFFPRRARSAALALAFVIFAALIGVFLGQVGARVVKQAQSLNERLPDMLARWQQPMPAATPANSLKDELMGKIRLEAALRSGELVSALPRYGMRILTAASGLIYLAIIPILAFFFLKEGHVIREDLLSLVTQRAYREMLDGAMADINLLLAGYMRALVGLTLIAFATYSIFFTILGTPYGILLAAVAGILEFIPMMGPIAASVSILLVVGVAGSHLLAVLIFLPIFRIVQDDIISPHLMEKGLELHPLMVLFGVFAGAEIAGVAGTFLSVPVLALVRILYLQIRKARLAASAVSVVSAG